MNAVDRWDSRSCARSNESDPSAGSAATIATNGGRTKTISGAIVQRARATPAVNMSDELRVLPKRMQSAGEELANSISHGIGLCAALIGAPILLLEARRSTPGFFLGTVIFVVTMSMLYLGSTLYHAWQQTRGNSVLAGLDRSSCV